MNEVMAARVQVESFGAGVCAYQNEAVAAAECVGDLHSGEFVVIAADRQNFPDVERLEIVLGRLLAGGVFGVD